MAVMGNFLVERRLSWLIKETSCIWLLAVAISAACQCSFTLVILLTAIYNGKGILPVFNSDFQQMTNLFVISDFLQNGSRITCIKLLFHYEAYFILYFHILIWFGSL